MTDANTSFTASSVKLMTLLENARTGRLQLPDFQRSWVWDEERIRSLIASISRGFPVGAVMSLRAGGALAFKARPLEGAPAAETEEPESLLLDGQQRLTSLYQVLLRDEVVSTITPRRQRVKRWFYLDIQKCLDDEVDRDEAVVIVPEGKQFTSDFGRMVDLDLTTRAHEIDNLMFPLSAAANWMEWFGFAVQHLQRDPARMSALIARLTEFHDRVVKNFTEYLVPVIELSASTSKEAVCVVFEKVNTGGKPLDAFELITAIYAADGYELRKDWYGEGDAEGRHARFRAALKLPSAVEGVLAGVGNTDFLQVVSLFHTRDRRRAAEAEGRTGKELPRISATRQSLLDLPLEAYRSYQDRAEEGFLAAAKFVVNLGVYRVKDLPYQSQITPLAAILAELGPEADSPAALDKIRRWYWNGVFGELYGSSTETRFARDFIEVCDWVRGGEIPSTVLEATMRADRLDTMRMRLSAAYKGVNALLMHEGAMDFRTGQRFNHTIFFDENVDIHHVFPQDWCKRQGIHRDRYDSIVNKTPLSARTNRIIGGHAPSQYLKRIEDESDRSPGEVLDSHLRSHLIDPSLLRADDFDAFMSARKSALVRLIEQATGKPVVRSTSDSPSGASEIDENPTELDLLGPDAI